MAKKYWFKPKCYGYGATPTTWEGWACTADFIAVVIWRATTFEAPNPKQLALELGILAIILSPPANKKPKANGNGDGGGKKRTQTEVGAKYPTTVCRTPHFVWESAILRLAMP